MMTSRLADRPGLNLAFLLAYAIDPTPRSRQRHPPTGVRWTVSPLLCERFSRLATAVRERSPSLLTTHAPVATYRPGGLPSHCPTGSIGVTRQLPASSLSPRSGQADASAPARARGTRGAWRSQATGHACWPATKRGTRTRRPPPACPKNLRLALVSSANERSNIYSSLFTCGNSWAQLGSNQRPLACKARTYRRWTWPDGQLTSHDCGWTWPRVA
jgi:hypothetical protein